MATPSSSSKVSLKLLIDTKTRRVLFAEAGKEFVDFLFTLLSLPLGSVTKLLSTNNMVGCLGNLYKSIEDLSDSFIQPTQTKATVLNPKSPSTINNSTLLLSSCRGYTNESAAERKLYYCSACYANPSRRQYVHSSGCYQTVTRELFVAGNQQAVCPHCSQTMSSEAQFIDAGANKDVSAGIKISEGSGGGGFVKGIVTYMVMDNLEVRPMSTISSITLLNKFNIQEVGSLQEKVIQLGMPEGLKLLKASLSTKTVLTTVFLGS